MLVLPYLRTATSVIYRSNQYIFPHSIVKSTKYSLNTARTYASTKPKPKKGKPKPNPATNLGPKQLIQKSPTPAVSGIPNPLDQAIRNTPPKPSITESNIEPSVPAISHQISPASKLGTAWASVRAMYIKNRDGLQVLIKQDIPKYRTLKRAPKESLSRSEWLFIERVRTDIKRLIPFGILLFVLPEIIPFLVVRGFVPSTCMDQSDRVKQWTKLRIRREQIAIGLYTNLAKTGGVVNPNRLLTIQSVRELGLRDIRDFHMGRLQRKQLKFMMQFLGLSPYSSLHPYSVRVLRVLDDILEDDKRIAAQPNCIKEMTDSELAEASERRGISTVSSVTRGGTCPSRKELEFALNLWIEMNTDPLIPKGLVVFARIVQAYTLMRHNGTNLVANV